PPVQGWHCRAYLGEMERQRSQLQRSCGPAELNGHNLIEREGMERFPKVASPIRQRWAFKRIPFGISRLDGEAGGKTAEGYRVMRRPTFTDSCSPFSPWPR